MRGLESTEIQRLLGGNFHFGDGVSVRTQTSAKKMSTGSVSLLGTLEQMLAKREKALQ